MAKKSKKTTPFKKFVITCSVLIVAQIAFLAFQSSSVKELSPRASVNAALEKSGEMTDERKDKMRIQLALADFRSRTGSFPKALSDLIPEYFDVVPVDSQTGQAMSYTLAKGRYRLGTPGKSDVRLVSGSGKEKIDPLLLAGLEADGTERASFVYDPSGKRDPFFPMDLAPKIEGAAGKTELEQYAIGQLRYASFLSSSSDPIAIVENSVRRGFTVRRGTKIGPNGGTVIEILPNKIQILEVLVDPITKEKTNNIVELELRPKAK